MTQNPLARRFSTRAATGQVTPTELFFDLVFVFVVTQATHQVEAHPTWEGLGHALLPLVVVWWMFLAFGWLTNAVRPDPVPIRLLLLLAMMAFFVVGLDLPYAFEPDGWAFPVAYLCAVAIHTGLFLTASLPSARRGILRIVPFNAAGGVLVLVAPHLPEPAEWAAWVLAVLLLYTSSLFGRVKGFAIEPHHFVERHGLIVLLVLGESIVAIGIGAAGEPVDLRLAAGVVLGLALAAGIWGVYFDGDEERAVHALEGVSEERRQLVAFNAFTFGHVTMVLGVVVVAAGITDAIHHFDDTAHRWLLGGGAAVFLLGHAVHRGALHSGRVVDRVVAAVVTVPLAAVGSEVGGWLALALVATVLLVVSTLDHRASAPASAETAGAATAQAGPT